MAASDHLHPVLFHGTKAELGEGDIVVPKPRVLSLFGSQMAFATDNPHHARFFGPNVYEVEPVDPKRMYGPEEMPRYDDNDPDMVEYTSPVGFRVIRRHTGRLE